MAALTHDKFFSAEEIEEILQIAKVVGGRDQLLIEFALYTGAREGEIVQVSKADLDSKEQKVYIRHAEKGSNPRWIRLKPEFFARLSAYAGQQRDLIFPITTRKVRQIWESHRPVNKRFHAFRHSFGRMLRDNLKRHQQQLTGGKDMGATIDDLEAIMELMGHKAVSSTMIYIKEGPSEQTKNVALGL